MGELDDEGAALIEAAFVLPVLIMLLVGTMMFGLALVDDLRLERAATDAAELSEDEAHQVVSSVDGRILCWWQGEGEGGCYDDGLDMARTQIIAEGRAWHYPTGKFVPMAYISRPEGET